jgi:hypothetical protein
MRRGTMQRCWPTVRRAQERRTPWPEAWAFTGFQKKVRCDAAPLPLSLPVRLLLLLLSLQQLLLHTMPG